MLKHLKPDWLLIIILLTLITIYLSGIAIIPFHPDESTQMSMSADFDTMMKHPALLVWNPSQAGNLQQNYRLLDAPLTRYMLGIGRALAGLPPPSGFWDWTKDWQENFQIGAYPEAEVLLAGRIVVSLLFPFSLIFLYLSTSNISGRIGGYAAIIILGLNALVLLHTRRAMAEGSLLFGITAVMASWRIASRRPWLAGLAMAIAFNAKQSSLALLPVGLIAVCWFIPGNPPRIKRIIGNILQYLFLFTFLTWLVNPVAWQQPMKVARAAAQARADLLSDQVADTQLQAPSQVLERPVERAVMLLGHLYLTPPMFAEVENYRSQTSTAEAKYLENPFNNLGRNYLVAGILLVLAMVGLYAAIRQGGSTDSHRNRYTILLLLGTTCMIAGLLVAVPLPWQRYVLPLIPFACLWTGVGCSWVFQLSHLIRRNPQPQLL